MQDIFITGIHIGKIRHLENIDIALSDAHCKHLILTGKNGSGKTSLLEALRDSVLYEQKGIRTGRSIRPNIDVVYSKNISNFSDFIFVYIAAERSKFVLPKSIEAVDIQDKTKVTRNASKDFLRYILSLDYQLYGAKSDNNVKLEASLTKWFDNFLAALRNIYDCRELQLQRDTKNLAFKIVIPGREPFALHEMSDGYAAFLDIFMELVMRFESDDMVVKYEQPAIVMIDEIETHLHVELQKRALPFLTQMFPNIQLVVSTHSPFVITSLSDAVVYDLENNEQLENPNVYSYEAVVEGYLNVGQYSEEMKAVFGRYKELYGKELSNTESIEFRQLVSILEMVPPASKELYLAFRTMEDKRKR